MTPPRSLVVVAVSVALVGCTGRTTGDSDAGTAASDETSEGTGSSEGTTAGPSGSSSESSESSESSDGETTIAPTSTTGALDLPSDTDPLPATCGDGILDPGELCYVGPFEVIDMYSQSAEQLELVDLNGDGDLDLALGLKIPLPGIILEGTLYEVQTYLGDGAGGFSSLVWSGIPQSSGIDAGMIGADVDEDGARDLVLAGNFAQTAALLRGDGAGGVAEQLELNIALNWPTDLAVVDLDGDAHLDLALIGSAGDGIASALGDGAGGFGPPLVKPATTQNQFLTVADLDGDAVPDAAVGAWGTPTLYLYFGAGDGSFAEPVERPIPTPPSNLESADLDGDGDPELLVITQGEQVGLLVLRNLGDGGFSKPDLYPYPVTAALAVGRCDGDEHPDVVTINQDGDIFVFRGAGDRTLQAPVTFAAGAYGTVLKIGDLNGDGLADIVLGQASPGGVNVLLSDP